MKSSSEIEQVFKSWAHQSSHYIGECFDISKPFLDQEYLGIDPYVRFVSTQLYIDCQLTSESVLLLIQVCKEWDADMLLRSVMEGTIKYIYMLDGSQEEARERATEFWDILPAFADIKHSCRAKRFLEDVPTNTDDKWRAYQDLVLEDAQVDAIKQGWSRQKRVELEQRWSFAKLINSFSNSSNENLKLLVHLSHGYGMSSHLIHKDGVGVGIVWDRFRRDLSRQSAARLGHVSRIVSDINTFAKLRSLFLFIFCKQSTASIQLLGGKYMGLFNELDNAAGHFNRVEYGYRGDSQSE